MNAKERREKNKALRKFFNNKPPKWRIEAVIHDGSWYDVPKWASVAKVEEQDIYDWIDKYGEGLIKSQINSYRTSYSDIVDWYKKQNLEIEESIIPNNFPPKLWKGQTEIDIFLNAPRRRVGTVNMEIESNEMLAKVKNILKGVAKVVAEGGGSKYRAYGLSAVHMRNLLSKGLEEEEYKKLNIKMRSVLLQRELSDLPTEWLAEALPFYTKVFAPSLLTSSMSTINIYLPDQADKQAQILMWVITAMKKFDEDASVPFSGYLSSVLRYWPYDLPDMFLGKDLARFQREKKKAIVAIKGNSDEQENIAVDELSEQMGISLERFLELNEEHENWLAEVNATTLTWEDSANEKKGDILGAVESTAPDVSLMSKMSIAIVKAAVDTEEWVSAHTVITQMDSEEIDPDIQEKLAPEFIKRFACYLDLKGEDKNEMD